MPPPVVATAHAEVPDPSVTEVDRDLDDPRRGSVQEEVGATMFIHSHHLRSPEDPHSRLE